MIIRKYKISVDRFLFIFLPLRWRKLTRFNVMNAMVTPFKVMSDEFVAYRDKTHLKAHITNERLSLTFYLNSLFDPTLKRIYIQMNSGGGMYFGLRATEPTKYKYFGIRATEPTKYQYIGLEGEGGAIGYADFGVFIPAALASQSDAISAVVKVYAPGDLNFKIVQF